MSRPRVESNDGRVEIVNFFFVDCQIPMKDLQKLALNPVDIMLSKYASGDRPVDVFEGGIIRELHQEIRIRVFRLTR